MTYDDVSAGGVVTLCTWPARELLGKQLTACRWKFQLLLKITIGVFTELKYEGTGCNKRYYLTIDRFFLLLAFRPIPAA